MKIYYLIWILLTPFLPLILIYRVIKGKEKLNRLNERVGISNIKTPKEKLVWINAVSVGELRSTIPLMEDLIKYDLKILITSVTITSAEHVKTIIKNIKSKNVIHQFTPIDHPISIKKFINHWQPNSIIMIESEIWPNIIQISYKKMIPLILLQGRMSEKSYKKWLFFTSLSEYLYKKFSLIVSQDDKNAKRYKKLGGKNILAGINLKNSIPAPYMNNKEEKLLTSLLIKRQVILFASIHDDIEDEAAISSHISAKKHDINLITIIVPRHPKLLQNLISLTIKYKLKTKIRSQGQSIDKDTDIYIADTIGELGSFLKIANICFVGGSLSYKGGHNLAEPAFEKCAIIYGPDVSNHQKTSDILIKGKAAIQINNINELNNKITNLIKDKKKINVMAENAYKIINSIPSPNTVLLNKLKPFLKI